MRSTAGLPAWALLLHLCLCVQYKCLCVPALVLGLLSQMGKCTLVKHCCFHCVLGERPPALDIAEIVVMGTDSSIATTPLCSWKFTLQPKQVWGNSLFGLNLSLPKLYRFWPLTRGAQKGTQ